MWYFILALLFGTPSNGTSNQDETVASAQSEVNIPGDESGTGGTTNPVRPK
ncbi:hypothetical protein [Sphingobacterium faecium]|uniref:hypothetical protein n=1 Tax=Sphingobacterium faecium TaxID=34087 RepID=UPI00097ECC84|nr:hypothetical protein [Sphingobacterium faecium]WGQ13828.1 hypothetical protein QG727_17560 [Sphingobacterium faecium]SJN45852.1 hypothetical protein FM120_17105 [Sphingobacterium faecium PCAi_F2.5]